MAKKVRGPQFIPSALNTPMINYNEYYMNGTEKFLTFLVCFVCGGLVGLIFYGNQFLDEDGNATNASMIGNIFIFIIAGLIAVKVLFPMRTEQLRAKRRNELREQFRSFLGTLAVSLSSGMNMMDSLLSSYDDLRLQYSDKAYIVSEVKEMIDGMENNVPIEQMMSSLGERSSIDDIKNFGVVFDLCYRAGGNMKDIVRRTSDIISEKIEIEAEIDTALTSNKSQFMIMMIIPVGMVLMIRTMMSSFARSFATVPGVIAVTIAIGIFIGAYKLGTKIMDVKG
ncbi:type II secretion system F family protein [Butyrivibrio sp. AE2032]|uniref:type II secretion system F family protein n=1 Tax=Butyrivibrio sp. AE2032 TaxID=1458463 RepID=UPI000559811D|nr:type II secretion system F family protein [Butyrivibrio sp. AE2032]